jgi:hypothetical protein
VSAVDRSPNRNEREHLFPDLDLAALGYGVVRRVPGERALHVVMARHNGD